MLRLSVFVFGLLSLVLTASADNADDVIARVLENVAKLNAADPEAVPMAFWDFDGTIIKGDVSEGLTENVRELVLARPHGVAVAGFGNSYHTDGPFLRYIATQPSLPGGIRATSVMINGGKARPGYTEHFKTIDEKDVIGR